MGLLVCAALAAWFPLVRVPMVQATRVWRGYQTLLVRAGPAGAGAARIVAGALGPGVATEETSTVDFWSFTGLESVSIARLDARLDPRDPRHDAFMDRAKGYFRPDADTQLVYIPARLPSARVFLRIAAHLGVPARGSWRLIEFDPVEKSLAVLGLFGFALLLAACQESPRRIAFPLAAAAAFLWTPYVLSGGLDRLAFAMASLLPWSELMRVLVVLHGWDEKLVREMRPWLAAQAGVAVTGLVIQTLLAGPSLLPVLSYLPPLLGTLLLLAGVAGIWGRAKRTRKKRAAFAPIPIVRPAREPSRVARAALLIGGCFLIIVALVALLRNAPLPTPLPLPGARDFSWAAVARLRRAAGTHRLPDFSSLVLHEALQEGMAFGRSGGLPTPDERVYLRTYVNDGSTGIVTERQRMAKTFDTTWLRSVLGRATPGSIAFLLREQRRPVAVAVRGPFRWIAGELLAVLLAVAALLVLLARDPGVRPLIEGILLRFNSFARRNQIP